MAMLQRVVIWIAWIAVMGLALWLRVHDLEARPIHADEATGAHIFAQLVENANYRFDPTHFHGPLLSLSTWPVAQLYGQSHWQELSLSMLRMGPVLAGLLTVLTPLLWLRSIGTRAALAAAALLACSPLLVYYNRMYIHESWLALFGMLAAAAIFGVIKQPSRNRALLAGLATGLMFATKETFAISLLAWALAGAAVWLIRKSSTGGVDTAPPWTAYLKPAIWFTLTLLLVGTIFYTQGLRQPGGIVDALRTYFVYETTPGHDKPFGYYFEMLVWPKQLLGMWWSEGGVAILALLSCALGAWKKPARVVIGFIALGALLHVLSYSLISYKTPWLMLLPWALLCLLAACVFCPQVKPSKPSIQFALYLIFGLTLLYQGYQARQASGRLANHPHNPYAYVPTSNNMPQLSAWLMELKDFNGGQVIEPIAVVGREYWPLPWYLRSFGPVGYWAEAPDAIHTFPIVLAMPSQTRACSERLAASHTQLPRTLRSNVHLTLFLHNELWNRWTDPAFTP